MPELSPRRRVLVLAICCMSLLIVGMDNTIIIVGLRAIQQDLHTSLTDLQWTVDAYLVVLASLLMFAGSMGDRLGRRRVFQFGLTIFTVSSLLCSLAPGLGWLVAFRAVQAVGGSMLNPVALSIIANVFTERRERARALGVWGGVNGLSLALGPVVGGLLIDSLGWRSMFWINVPVGVAAIALTALFVPESRAARVRRPDPVGQVSVTAMLGGLTFAIIESPRDGWGSTSVLTAICIAALGAVVFALYEPRRVEPLVDLRFFRSTPFAGATAIAVCAFAGFAGFLFLISLYLQSVRGLSPLAVGGCLVPFGVLTVCFSPVAGRLVGHRGSRTPLVIAGALLTVGGLLLVPTSADESYLRLLVSISVYAVGYAFVNTPITNTAVSGMPNAQAGVAAAIASTCRQVGAALGVAVVGSVLAATGSDSLRDQFAAGGRAAWWVITGCSVAVLLLGLLTTGRRARATAERTAHLIADEPALAH